jgi:hypothetical protein
MQPGPTYIIACPLCGALAKQHTVASGNTFGAIFWSDGKQDAPMRPDYPVVTKCGRCYTIYWVEDARQLGELPLRAADAPGDWHDAPGLTHLSVDDLSQALSAGLGDFPERERHLRIRLWWAINDMIRYRPSGGSPLALERASQEYEQHRVTMVDNCVRLAELLDEGRPEHRIMKAEIARELGQFGEARRLLLHVPDEYAWVARQLAELVADGDSSIHRLFQQE